mmetsp:Transcript_17082/g.19184  ORF Transcript_17082/g.19184 Transcript_17082/m.19184 type:complete len:274 (-) Transcript_17082:193-1014(-)
MNKSRSAAALNKRGGSVEPGYTKSLKIPDMRANKKHSSIRSPREDMSSSRKTAKKKAQPERSKLPRNVNIYRHILNGTSTRDSDLEWILELRQKGLQKKFRSPEGEPSLTASKGDEKKETRKKLVDVEIKGDHNASQHLLRHRLGMTANRSQANFELGLRDYKNDGMDHNRKWNKQVLKRGHSQMDLIPEFLPPLNSTLGSSKFSRSQFMASRQSRMTEGRETVIGFDGSCTYPEFSEKLSERNVNQTRHLYQSSKDIKSIQWETGLRFYSRK